VVFGRRSLPAGGARLTTNGGFVEASAAKARVRIGGAWTRNLKAAEIDAPPRPGLLPAMSFAQVHVSHREGVVVLVP
jgi:hypothetical protein